MADSRIWSVKDMATDEIADGTLLYFVIREDQDVIEDEGAIVANPESLTVSEKLYVQSRFILQNESDPTDVQRKVSDWEQVNTTRFPDLNTGSFLQGLKHIFETQRESSGLKPTI